MQIQFNTDKTIEGHERMQNHFSEEISESFKRFEDKITRVEVHVGDENNEKFGVEVRLIHREQNIEQVFEGRMN